jgi:hypothetical protein
MKQRQTFDGFANLGWKGGKMKLASLVQVAADSFQGRWQNVASLVLVVACPSQSNRMVAALRVDRR